VKVSNKSELYRNFTPHDLARLSSYTQNLLDYHVILDLVPIIAKQYFIGALDFPYGPDGIPISLSAVQSAILVGVGLQRKGLEELEKELKLPNSQIMALFVKTLKRLGSVYAWVEERGIEQDMQKELEENEQKKKNSTMLTTPSSSLSLSSIQIRPIQDSMNSQGQTDNEEENKGKSDESQGEHKNKKRDLEDEEAWDPVNESLQDEVAAEGNNVLQELKIRQREAIESLNLEQYAIHGSDAAWESVELKKGGSSIVSIINPESHKKKKMKRGIAESLIQKNQDKHSMTHQGKGKKVKKNLHKRSQLK